MTNILDGSEGIHLTIGSIDIQKAFNTKPTLCAVRQPWKNPNIEMFDIVMDLMGTIISFQRRYQKAFNADYPLEYAVSDAVIGIMKAIEKDKLAPSRAGKAKTCRNCGETYKIPDELPDDEEANALFRDCEFGECPPSRKAVVECEHCGAEAKLNIPKTIFSTHVFPFIRAEIQRGVKEARGRKGVPSDIGLVSLNQPVNEDGEIIDIIEATPTSVEEDDLPVEVKNAISEVINGFPENHQRIISFHFGLGGYCNDVVSKSITCQHCNLKDDDGKIIIDNKGKPIPTQFETEVDYSRSINYAKCPDCGAEYKVDMTMKQTDIATTLGVSKQRICAMVQKIQKRIHESLEGITKEFGLD